MSVQLIIKSAAQSVEDFKLDCEMTWTIEKVKEQLTALYPTKPAKEHQKLIYGGKLLPDHLPLTSILNPTQDVHILHLVCPFPLKSESHKSNTNTSKSVPSACTVPPLNPSGIYPQVNQQLPTPPVFASASPVVAGTLPPSPADPVYQYLAMQQMYTQFMTQYLSQYNGNNPYGQIPVTTPPVQQPASPAPQQNVNRNVEARPAGEGWDIIDLLYLFSRATMLFAILIYYSSPPRVIAVCVMVLFLTFFAKMNRERQREEMRRADERPPAENAVQEAEVESTGNEEERPENSSAEAQPTPLTPQTHLQSALSVPSTILAVITSFFTSLIPADPVPVNVN